MKLPSEVLSAAKLLVAKMYYSAENGAINHLRHYLFFKNLAKNDNLPPTEDSLHLHIMRANFQCYIWKQTLNPKPDIVNPVGNGWTVKDGTISPLLMTKEPAPKSLLEVTTCSCKSSRCQGRCSCSAQGLVCTIACNCAGEEDCNNPHKVSCDRVHIDSDPENSDAES